MTFSGKYKFALLAAASFGALQAGAAHAQDAGSEQASEDNVITVTGIRSSLESAIQRKRNADQVVDSIEAEDIGKLPDDNAARALSRVPGVQITQRNGVGSEIQLRGLSQVFVSLNNTTFVGTPSQQSSRDAVRRNFSLEDIPSELFAGFDVIKTPTADNIEGGIGGSVNLRTRAPLDLEDGLTLVGSAKLNYGELSEEFDPSASILIGGKLSDDFAFYVNGSYRQTTTRNDNMNWLNWDSLRINVFDSDNRDDFLDGSNELFLPEGVSTIASGDRNSATACTPFCWARPNPDAGFDPTLYYDNGTEVGQVLAPRQVEARQVTNNRETFGLNGAVEWQASDTLKLRFDGYYTQFEEVSNAFELRLNTEGQFNGAVVFAPDAIINSDAQQLDVVVSDNFSLLRGGFQPGQFSNSGFPQRQAGVVGFRDAETINLNFNANWQASDRLNASFNASYGDNTFNSIFVQQELRGGSGNTNGAFNGNNRIVDPRTGIAPAVVPRLRWYYDITDGSSPIGDLVAQSSLVDEDNFILAFVSLFEDVFKTEEKTFSADFDYDVDGPFLTSIEFGARYADRQNSRNVRRGIGQNFEAACNQVEQENFSNVTDLTRCMELGGTFLTADRIGVDPFRELQDVGEGVQYAPVGLIREAITVTDGSLFQGLGGDFERTFLSGNPIAYQNPIEDLAAVWGIRPEADPINDYRIDEETLAGYLKANFETGALSGNIGARLIKTNVTSSGFAVAEGAQQLYLFSQIFDNYDTVTARGDYWDFLPSLNVKFDASDNLVLRFGAARVVSRPNLTDLAPGLFIRSLVDRTAIEGDPGLEPFRATQLDLSAEYYFNGGNGLISAAVFYKDIDSFITTSIRSEMLIDGFGQEQPFTVISPINDSAKVKGFELGFQQALTFLPAPLDGFGVLLNYTYADSETPTGFALPELSKHSYNAIGYYEKGGFSARLAYNWRDDRLFRAGGFGGQPEFIESFGTLDFGMSYDFSDKFSVNFEAVNLTKENLSAYTSFEDRRLSFSQFDRQFSLGVQAKF